MLMADMGRGATAELRFAMPKPVPLPQGRFGRRL